MPFSLIKPGDWVVLLIGMLFTVWLAGVVWQSGAADKVIIRSGGKTFREVSLMRDQTIDVPGPLGVSVITIRNRQARVVSDPGPRQYCVLQGWLKHAGEAAICLPNQVSLELSGARKIYDSLNY
jgi:hypothetical protein